MYNVHTKNPVYSISFVNQTKRHREKAENRFSVTTVHTKETKGRGGKQERKGLFSYTPIILKGAFP